MTADFNWLEEYGPHWEPGSTAFWLEPRKADDLKAWLGKYRPDFHGEMTIGLVTVSTPRRRDYLLTDKPKPAPELGQAQSAFANAMMNSQYSMLQNASGLSQYRGLQGARAPFTGSLFGGLF